MGISIRGAGCWNSGSAIYAGLYYGKICSEWLPCLFLIDTRDGWRTNTASSSAVSCQFLSRAAPGASDCVCTSQVPEVARGDSGPSSHMKMTLRRIQPKISNSAPCSLYFIRCSGVCIPAPVGVQLIRGHVFVNLKSRGVWTVICQSFTTS
jgi:hypothetical protein